MNISEYLRESVKAMSSAPDLEADLEYLSALIWERLQSEGTVFWLGNGGSAGDSQHLATELVGRFARLRKPLKSIALTTNASLITALANDDGYDTVFSRQVEAFVQPIDVVIGISTSGQSVNVLHALRTAKDRGALVIGFTGFNKNPMDELADYVFHAPSMVTGVIQQMHITFGQALCLGLENRID